MGDGEGFETSTEELRAHAEKLRALRFGYDGAGRITSWTDSLGRRTTYHLNESGQTIREVDPAGNETLSEWDGHDQLLSRSGARCATTTASPAT